MLCDDPDFEELLLVDVDDEALLLDEELEEETDADEELELEVDELLSSKSPLIPNTTRSTVMESLRPAC